LRDGAAMRGACLRRSVFSLGVVPPLLLLIPNTEANERYTFPLYFYRCDNGQTLVSQFSTKTDSEQANCLRCTRTPLRSVRRSCGSRKGGNISLSVISSTTATCGGVVTTVMLVSGESNPESISVEGIRQAAVHTTLPLYLRGRTYRLLSDHGLRGCRALPRCDGSK